MNDALQSIMPPPIQPLLFMILISPLNVMNVCKAEIPDALLLADPPCFLVVNCF